MVKNVKVNEMEDKELTVIEGENLTVIENAETANEMDEPETEQGALTIEGNEIDSKMKMQRKEYPANGKKYWAYFVEGLLRNKKVEANFMPADKGGYKVLDETVFADGESADLVLVPYEMRDKITNKVTQRGFTYKAQNYDDTDKMIYSLKVKPQRDSDKALLEMLLHKGGVI